jgi:hypothetical protein
MKISNKNAKKATLSLDAFKAKAAKAQTQGLLTAIVGGSDPKTGCH